MSRRSLNPYARAAQRPLLLLIVDDNLDALEIYCTCLEFAGFRCIQCESAEQGIAEAKAKQPALILMDASMPGMDGWQATRHLKADPATAKIPVVMLTAHAFAEHRLKAEAVGADGFLAKPILPDKLADEVRRLLDKHPGQP